MISGTPADGRRASLRVLIISRHPMLGQAMETWLRHQQGIDVVGWEEDVSKAGDGIEILEPDVIIIDTTDTARTPLEALMCKLADRPGAKIMKVNLEDNSISLFSSQEQTMDCVEWLLTIMRGIPPVNPPGHLDD